jgi:DeoR family fructose operon transcriptional repressor
MIDYDYIMKIYIKIDLQKKTGDAMLTEERQEEIVRIVNAGGAASVQELVDYFHISEATVRRDLTVLQQAGRLRRVHGGATAIPSDTAGYEANMEELEIKYAFHLPEKRRIAQYAAGQIGPADFVYLDAGSTVEQMADFLSGSTATFVTNSLPLAQKLARNGCQVRILAGHVKGTTSSVVGSEVIQLLRRYHFTKGFFGANGLSLHEGCTTPDIEEAATKEAAVVRCNTAYILADASKFGLASHITFAELPDVTIITAKSERIQDFSSYQQLTEVHVL